MSFSPGFRRLLCLAAVAAAAALCYAGTLRHGFVWDDQILIAGNPALAAPDAYKRILSPSFWTSVSPLEGAARPLSMLTLMVDRALWGFEPAGYHLTNVLLHAAVSVLVVATATLLGLSFPAAVLAGLLFGLHPVNSEAVNLPSFRPDILAALFTLLALFSYVSARRASTRGARRAWGLGALAAFALGMLSKESAASFPFVALLWEWTLARRPLGPRRLAALVAGFALAVGAYATFRSPRSGYGAIAGNAAVRVHSSSAQRFDLRAALRRGEGLSSRAMHPSRPQWSELYAQPGANFRSMSVIFAEYFRLLFWPHPLRADRMPPQPAPGSPGLWAAWLLFAGLGASFWWARRRLPWWSWCIGWWAAALLPVSNAIPIFNPFAERYLYLACVAACWALAEAFFRAAASRPAWAGGVAALLLAGQFGATQARNRDWRSDEALFGREVERGTQNARVHFNVGVQAQRRADWTAAAQAYRRAAALKPGYTEALTNLAAVYEATGQEDRALQYYRAAAATGVPLAQPHDALGALLLRRGRPGEAAAALRRAVALDPGFALAWMHLGEALARLKRRKEALECFAEARGLEPGLAKVSLYNAAQLYEAAGDVRSAEKSIRDVTVLDPRGYESATELGVLLHRQGELAKAESWLGRAARLSPGSPVAHYNLGSLLADRGRLAEARAQLAEAVRLKSDYADALYSLAVVSQRLGRAAEAADFYRKTVRAEPRKLEAWNNLGGLHEQAGRLDDAEKAFSAALAIDPSRPAMHNNLGNVLLKRGRLEQAEREYRTAIELSNRYGDSAADIAPLRVNRGLALRRLGRLEEAVSEWRAAAGAGSRTAAELLAEIR